MPPQNCLIYLLGAGAQALLVHSFGLGKTLDLLQKSV